MATHAGMRRGNSRESGLFHRSVTVTAVDAVVRHVMLMAEGHGLLPSHVDVGVVGGLVDGIDDIAQPPYDQSYGNNRGLGDYIRTGVEKLRHRSVCLTPLPE